jgi:hypothetical protein
MNYYQVHIKMYYKIILLALNPRERSSQTTLARVADPRMRKSGFDSA